MDTVRSLRVSALAVVLLGLLMALVSIDGSSDPPALTPKAEADSTSYAPPPAVHSRRVTSPEPAETDEVVRLQVVDPEGNPIAGARLYGVPRTMMVVDAGEEPIAIAGEDGRCSLGPNELESGGIGVAAAGYQSRHLLPMELGQADSGNEIVVVLLTEAIIKVHCVDQAGSPIPGCLVSATRKLAPSLHLSEVRDRDFIALDSVRGTTFARSGESGVAELRGLRATQYLIDVRCAGYCPTTVGRSVMFVAAPGSVRVTLAPIQVARVRVSADPRSYLWKMSPSAPGRDSNGGVAMAVRDQIQDIDDEIWWARLGKLDDDSGAHGEKFSIVFENGSRQDVDVPYMPLRTSRPVVLAPGEARNTYEVSVAVGTQFDESLELPVRVARLSDLGSEQLTVRDFDVAMNTTAPTTLKLPSGRYQLTVVGTPGLRIAPRMFEVNDGPEACRLMIPAAMQSVTVNRVLPRGYGRGLWNVSILTEASTRPVRRTCSPFEDSVTLLVPVGRSVIRVNGAELRGIEKVVGVGASEALSVEAVMSWD